MSPPPIADTPPPPYYAVIFATVQSADPERAGDLRDYPATAQRMEELAAEQSGYLGTESARAELGITVSYWADEDSIRAWKSNAEHTLARETGRARWYDRYVLRVAKVERDYGWSRV
jgi:heme-degrading monooxygenase HmoA